MPRKAAGLARCLSRAALQDAKAMEWLTQAFGFSKHMAVTGPEGDRPCDLSLGNGMVMFASGGKQGDEILDDGTERHLRRGDGYRCALSARKAAGAEIVRPLADTAYGRGITASAI